MEEEGQEIRRKISEALIKQFPDLKPKIAEITGHRFIYELEKHDNYTYFVVNYHLSGSGELEIDWGNAELAVF